MPRNLVRTTLMAAALAGMATTARLAAQTSGEAEIREEFRQRGYVPEARQKLKEARELEAAGMDKDAADLYQSLLRNFPKMVEALNDLAYLQATSADPRVRNPAEAVANGERLLVQSIRMYNQRRQFRPPENVKNPFNNLGIEAAFYKITIMNTLAAAYAAAGNFTAESESCKPTATSMAEWAVGNAQVLFDKNPSADTQQLLRDLKSNLEEIRKDRALPPGRLRFRDIS